MFPPVGSLTNKRAGLAAVSYLLDSEESHDKRYKNNPADGRRNFCIGGGCLDCKRSRPPLGIPAVL
jgi:hypothetical protein